MNVRAMVAAGVGTAVLGGLAALAQSQDPRPLADAKAEAKEKAARTGQGRPGGFPDLVAGLKATPGCLGVETARTGSGKNVIFAWFKDKKAALAWYYSDMHQEAMHGFGEVHSGRKPMAEVPDDGGPIMAIASITMSADGKSRFEGVNIPISQIAVELYRPVNGGLYLGGRFAPEAMEVPGMKVYTPKPDKE